MSAESRNAGRLGTAGGQTVLQHARDLFGSAVVAPVRENSVKRTVESAEKPARPDGWRPTPGETQADFKNRSNELLKTRKTTHDQ